MTLARVLLLGLEPAVRFQNPQELQGCRALCVGKQRPTKTCPAVHCTRLHLPNPPPESCRHMLASSTRSVPDASAEERRITGPVSMLLL